MDDNLLGRYVALQEEKRRLEEQIKAVKVAVERCEKELIAEFERASVSSVRQNGTTVFLHRQLFASPVDGDYARACAALKAAGLSDMVIERCNTNTVSAYFRELDRDGQEPPDELAGSFKIAEVFSIRTRGA